MSDYVIMTDSTCDLGEDLLKKYEINYAAMNYAIGGKEFPASANWACHSASEFYNLLRSGEKITTTQVPASTYERKFTDIFASGQDILYIACSSALSGSVNTARLVADELASDYPDRKVICLDSLISSLGEGYLALTAAKNRSAGMSLEENAAAIEAMKLTVNQFGTVETLDYLKRAGRVTATSAFFGNFMGIKPILISDRKGQNLAVKKVKGSAAAYRTIATMIAEKVIAPEDQTLYLSHADAPEAVAQLREEILKLSSFKEVYVHDIAPIVGASVGPGTVIAFCVGQEVTEQGETN